MSSRPRTPGSVTAVGIVAILSSAIVLLGALLTAAAIVFIPVPSNGPALPDSLRYVTAGIMVFVVGLAVFGVFTGVGLLRLKNWARISALIWAGFAVVFGGLAMVFGFLMPLPTTSSEAIQMMPVVRVVVLVFYGVPLGIGIWWLIFLNRRKIADQFAGRIDTASARAEEFLLEKPIGPLPIMVLAGFQLVSSILTAMLLLLFPLPAILFGYVIHGKTGTLVFLLTCLVSAVIGVGLLKLKPWAYTLGMAWMAFGLISGVASLLSPNYEAVMQEALKSMPFQTPFTNTHEFFRQIQPSVFIGLLFPLAILGLLIFYRSRFLEAASAAKKANTTS
jgi:hypothetical protein